MNEFYLNAYELYCITGRPLLEILHDLKTGKIPSTMIEGERRISSRWIYPELYQ